MKIKLILCCLLSSSLLVACNSSDSDSDSEKTTNKGGSESSTVFNDFVLDLVQNQTSDTADAKSINALTFEFEVEGTEDETVFDALL